MKPPEIRWELTDKNQFEGEEFERARANLLRIAQEYYAEQDRLEIERAIKFYEAFAKLKQDGID